MNSKKWEQVVHIYWHRSMWNQCQEESLHDSLQNKLDWFLGKGWSLIEKVQDQAHDIY